MPKTDWTNLHHDAFECLSLPLVVIFTCRCRLESRRRKSLRTVATCILPRAVSTPRFTVRKFSLAAVARTLCRQVTGVMVRFPSRCGKSASGFPTRENLYCFPHSSVSFGTHNLYVAGRLVTAPSASSIVIYRHQYLSPASSLPC